ncbi:LysR family transcriptional regulator [Azospirillum sp. TSA2s]|uniref:LysR family transcriptional regulator n=1 Tax=Azospirillum sp. TSA2s TaxID=709810 RepID=UPI0010A9B846|nr:LysR family transcriptional regulator [Azospirillum sp. TSA2s]QCG96411.1 LysR family transcriptional regulator [Azospirillum sp. TSA2s]
MFRKFVYLLALSREKHFGRAAESCHVSQPTLSNAIRQLEEELQVPIVERGQKFEGFTPEGMKVLEYARRIVGERDNLRHELLALAQGVTGHLRLGAIPTALPAVPHVLTPFATRFPHIRSSIVSLSSREIQRGLDEFELDAAITYLDNEPLNNVRTLPLYTERYYLLARRDELPEELVAQGAVAWEKAADLRLCLLTPDMQNRRIADTAFRMTGRTVQAAMETNSIVSLYTIVRTGTCASIVPGQLLTVVPPNADIIALPLVDPELSHVVGLAYADRDPPPPLARALAVAASDADIAQRVAISIAEAMIPWRLAIR